MLLVGFTEFLGLGENMRSDMGKWDTLWLWVLGPPNIDASFTNRVD